MSAIEECFFCQGKAPTDEQWNLLLKGEGTIDIADLKHFARTHKEEWKRFIVIMEGMEE